MSAGRREGMLTSLAHPHPETLAVAEMGLADWAARLPAEDEGLVDVNGGRAVRWVDGEGWIVEGSAEGAEEK